MFDEVGVKQSFENLSNSRSESNRAIVGGDGAVTLLRNKLNNCMISRRRIGAGNKNEEKKTTKNRDHSSSANSFRNLGGMPPGPEALSVFTK